MANPQKENGFTAIANEILENIISYEFPKNTGSVPYRLCFFVIRKTYGYQKKEDSISLTQFEEALGVSRPVVSYWLKYLVVAKLLLVDKTPNKKGFVYRFNKNYDEWLLVVSPLLLVVARKFTSKVATTITSKVATTYKRNKEMTKEISEQSSQSIVDLIKSFESVNPACKRMYGNITQRNACFDLIESYGFERVKNIIEKTLIKTNQIQFFPVITTPLQLRDKWVSLENAVKKYQSEKLKTSVAF